MIIWLIVAALFANYTQPLFTWLLYEFYFNILPFEPIRELGSLLATSSLASFFILGSPFILFSILARRKEILE